MEHMNSQGKIVTFPYMGLEYTMHIKKCLETLGIKVVLPPKISDETIKLGVKNSADMMCFPFKVTLGNFIEALNNGANILLMFDSCGECRLKQYYKLHELTLRRMGYKFEMYNLNSKTAVKVLKKLSGCSTIEAIKTLIKGIKEMKQIDNRKYEWSKDKLNIAIIGEIYTSCEERVNYDIEKKIKKFNVNVYNTANLSDFIYEGLKLYIFKKRNYKKEAWKYFNGPLGGHGYENVYNLLWLIDKKVDGVIHLLPLSCMPETTVEPIIDSICQDNKIPLLRLMIDETNSEANIDTRLETFIELIKRKNATNENKILVRN